MTRNSQKTRSVAHNSFANAKGAPRAAFRLSRNAAYGTLKTSYSICHKEGPKRVTNYDEIQLTNFPFGRMPYDKATLRSNVGKL